MSTQTYIIQEQTLTDIADAIRDKEGSSSPIQVSDFASRIENITTGSGKIDVVGLRHVIYDNTTSGTIVAPNSIPQNVFSFNVNSSEVYYSYYNNGYVSGGNSYKYYENTTEKTYQGLVIVFCRSNYTLPSHLELLAESEWMDDGQTQQKLFVCWCNSSYVAINQANSGRMEMQYIQLNNVKKPTSANVILNTIAPTGPPGYQVTATNKMCIFTQSSIFGFVPTDNTSLPETNTFKYIQGGYRLITEISTTAGQKLVKRRETDVPTAIIGIELDYES